MSKPTGRSARETAASLHAYRADLVDEIEPFLTRCKGLSDGTASPFLGAAWLRAWYATLGGSDGRRPVLVAVRSQATGADVMLLPMVSRRVAGISVIEFADAGIVDYNLPLFDPSLQSADAARSVWNAVRRALRGHGAVRLEKMPARSLDESGAATNPLTLALRIAVCPMQGHQAHAPADWEAWRHSLGKHARKELDRSWRVFKRSPTARFERIVEPRAALALLQSLEVQQATRMRNSAHRYRLDEPPYREVYRQALLGGVADGSVVLTALIDGDAVVAAQFSVANRHRFIALRISSGGEAWSKCSPGRLLLERTAAHLHAQGVRWFDFGIGDYAHKTVFGVQPIALFDAVEALSWRGVPLVWMWRLRSAARQSPTLVRLVRRGRAWAGGRLRR